MVEKLLSAAFMFALGYGIAFVAGWWFPWTSIVFGVLLLIAAVVASFDANSRTAAGFGGVVILAVFGILLFRSGRAELRSNAAAVAEVERIDKEIILAEQTLVRGKIEEAIRLCVDLELKVGDKQKTRLKEIKARAETELELRPIRIKEANERVAQLLLAAHKKVPNFNDVSDEAENLLGDTFAVPLATNLTAAQTFADDLVRRRVAAAKSLLADGRWGEAKEQIQAARAIKGATRFADANSVAATVANQVMERTVADATKLMESEDVATAEAMLRDVLNDPDVTERDQAKSLLETITKERVAVANRKLAGIVKKARFELEGGFPFRAEKLLSQAKEFPDATELADLAKVQEQVTVAIREKEAGEEQQRRDEQSAEEERMRELQSSMQVEANRTAIAKRKERDRQQAEKRASDRRANAQIAAEGFVKDQLISPRTANFGGLLSGDFQDFKKNVTILGKNEYLVVGWVDSHNGFGALVRSEFRVKLRDDGASWTLLEEPVIRPR